MTDKELAKLKAETIIEQLGGYGRLRAMVGAYALTYDYRSEAYDVQLCFRFKVSRRFNFCRVTLTYLDYYKVEFGQVMKNGMLRNEVKIEDQTAEDLIPLFEKTTGLYLRF